MTTEQLRELDAWIAEHVMQIDRHEYQADSRGVCAFCCHHYSFEAHESFRPTTSPADAMQVLEKCVEVVQVKIHKRKDGKWIVSKYEDIEPVWSVAETLELAICLFANQIFSKL